MTTATATIGRGANAANLTEAPALTCRVWRTERIDFQGLVYILRSNEDGSQVSVYRYNEKGDAGQPEEKLIAPDLKNRNRAIFQVANEIAWAIYLRGGRNSKAEAAKQEFLRCIKAGKEG